VVPKRLSERPTSSTTALV